MGLNNCIHNLWLHLSTICIVIALLYKQSENCSSVALKIEGRSNIYRNQVPVQSNDCDRGSPRISNTALRSSWTAIAASTNQPVIYETFPWGLGKHPKKLGQKIIATREQSDKRQRARIIKKDTKHEHGRDVFVNVPGLCPTTLRMNLFLVSLNSNYRVRPRARLSTRNDSEHISSLSDRLRGSFGGGYRTVAAEKIDSLSML